MRPFLLLMLLAIAVAEDVPTPAIAVPPLDADHALLARVLARIVRPDGIDYAALRADHADLDAYRAQLAAASLPTERMALMALVIDAYNAWTLALVAQLLPTDQAQWPAWSIRSAGSTFTSVWKRYTFELGGERWTLDHAEHEVLRKQGEPRIHLAINCASRSCPALAGVPYRAGSLDAQLAAAARAFAASPAQLRLEGEAVLTNPILDWFGADFAIVGGVRTFLAAQAPDGPVKAALLAGQPLRFFDYDWRLNLASPRR